MQKLTGVGLPQTEFAAFSKFKHAPDGLGAVFPIKPAISRQAG
jgi:hypothetical protein